MVHTSYMDVYIVFQSLYDPKRDKQSFSHSSLFFWALTLAHTAWPGLSDFWGHFSEAIGDLTMKVKDMSEVRNGGAVAANLTTQRL